MASVQFEHVTCRYAGAAEPAVSELDLTIADGELFALCGEAASGKSTVLRLLAGLVPATEGRIVVSGREIGHGEPPLISMVFQNYSIYPNLTVSENIALPLRQAGAPKRQVAERVDDAAAILDLTGMLGRKGAVLTAGQRIRVALARGLVREPAVLLMDEPLANLETGIHLEVSQLLVAAQRRHRITTVYATSDPEEALALGDRVGLMVDGRLQEVVVPGDLDSSAQGQRARGPG